MSNQEKAKNNFDQLENFGQGFIDLAPEDVRDALRFEVGVTFNQDKAKLEQRVIEFLGGLNELLALEKFLSFSRHDIEAHIIPSAEKFSEKEHRLQILAILTKHVSNKPSEYAGYIRFSFYRELQSHRPKIYIAIRRLETQGEGIGLDMECQLEDFCRKHDVWTIENMPTSDEETGDVGGYVWALYGYDFANKCDIELVIENIIDFAALNKITIDEQALLQCQRPIDFAKFKGKDKKGEEIPVGKLSLLKASQWSGRRDLQLDSQGTKDFVAYLKQRGREDLIEKYYPMFLEKNK